MSARDETEGISASSAGWMNAVSFWQPTRVVSSAWLEHAPFLGWLISVLEPKTFVELGTHNGFSFFSACETAARLGLPMRSYAIDTWVGDDHSGFYGEEIYAEVREVKERRYEHSAQLCRGYFSDFVSDFEDSSVDLLHIDGRHGYDDVTEDFESWLPKVSESGIVIFHDVEVTAEGFGVKKFWSEVRGRYPSFSFEHCNGLGVLAVGAIQPDPLRALLAADEQETARIRAFYSAQGSRVTEQFDLLYLRDDAPAIKQASDILRIERDCARLEAEALRTVVDETYSSTSWRITAPFRAVSARLRPQRPGPEEEKTCS